MLPLRAGITLIVLAALALPAVARADAFADFRIPDNRSLSWTGNGGSSGSWNGTESGLDRYQYGSFHESLGSAFAWLLDSESSTTSLTASVSLAGDRAHTFTHNQTVGGVQQPYRHYERTTSAMAQQVYLSASTRRYPGASPWCATAGVSFSGGYQQNWYRLRDHETIGFLPDQSEDNADIRMSRWSYENDASVSVGPGYGRVRNATGAYEARVLEDRLRASGAITRELGAAARERLAALLYARGDLSAVRDRPGPEVWGAIERILRSDGALRDSGVTAGEWFGLTSPYLGGARRGLTGGDGLPISPLLRQSGWTVAALLQGSTSHTLERNRDSTEIRNYQNGALSYQRGYDDYYRTTRHGDAAQAGLNAEIHRPLSLRWQADAAGSAFVNVRPRHYGYGESVDATLAWIVADRWLASARCTQSCSGSDTDDRGSRVSDWRVSALGSVSYYLLDRWSISANLQQVVGRSRNGALATPTTRSQSGQFSLGFTYRFAGFAAIPMLSGFGVN